MRRYVDSLKRLYKAGKIPIEKVNILLVENAITEEEYNYITEV